VATKALNGLGVSLEAAQEKVDETIGRARSSTTGSPPFTPRAKRVLEHSLREAHQLGHNFIGTEHILLGLVRDGEGVAVEVLVSLGADLSRVRQQVLSLLSAPLSKLDKLVSERNTLHQLIFDEVLRLRHEGISWADIGEVLRMTEQAAQAAYEPPPG
jgi:ATP-dependent Clp protease ATP-binding subunit ClpA